MHVAAQRERTMLQCKSKPEVRVLACSPPFGSTGPAYHEVETALFRRPICKSVESQAPTGTFEPEEIGPSLPHSMTDCLEEIVVQLTALRSSY